MRAFVSRCSEYIRRADEIEDISDSPWAIPFMMEKIYANVNPIDRKILRSGETPHDDVQTLCEKADKILGIDGDVIGAVEDRIGTRKFKSQPPRSKPRFQTEPPHYPTRNSNQHWQYNQVARPTFATPRYQSYQQCHAPPYYQDTQNTGRRSYKINIRPQTSFGQYPPSNYRQQAHQRDIESRPGGDTNRQKYIRPPINYGSQQTQTDHKPSN